MFDKAAHPPTGLARADTGTPTTAAADRDARDAHRTAVGDRGTSLPRTRLTALGEPNPCRQELTSAILAVARADERGGRCRST